MKKNIKSHKSLFLVFILSAAMVILTACGAEDNKTQKESQNVGVLEFDFMTGDYSFQGVNNAAEYRVRIFPVTDGEEEELPANESQAIRGGEKSYSGTVALWSLTPGVTYNAYLMVTDENGENSMSAPVTDKYTATYEAVNSGVTATVADTTITVTLDGDALENDFGTGADYEINLKKDGAEIEKKTISSAEIIEEEGESDSPWMTMKTYSGQVTFEGIEPDGNYTVTVTVIATLENYISSEVSQDFEVTNAAVNEQ